MTIFKTLVLVCIFPALAPAAGFVIVGTRPDGAVVFAADDPTGDLSHLGAPASPITTYYAIPKSTWSANATDAGDGVPVLVVSAGHAFNRGAVAVATERLIAARIAAKRQFLAWRQTLTTARQSLALAPGDAFFQSQVSQAASQVTSYAAQASIPVTPATTQ